MLAGLAGRVLYQGATLQPADALKWHLKMQEVAKKRIWSWVWSQHGCSGGLSPGRGWLRASGQRVDGETSLRSADAATQSSAAIAGGFHGGCGAVCGSPPGCSLPDGAVLVQTLKKIVSNHNSGLRAQGFQRPSCFPCRAPPAEPCAAAAGARHSEAFRQKVGSQVLTGWVS